MTKLYGFTTISEYQHVIGFGKWCLVWGIYMAKVPKRRLRWICYTTKDGKHIMAVSNEKPLIWYIVACCKFAKLKDELFEQCSLKELIGD